MVGGGGYKSDDAVSTGRVGGSLWVSIKSGGVDHKTRLAPRVSKMVLRWRFFKGREMTRSW